MAIWDSSKQKRWNIGKKGLKQELGNFAFTTTGLTVELPTKFRRIVKATFGSYTSPGAEKLETDGTVTSQGITVTRTITPYNLGTNCSGVAGAPYVTGNEWISVPVGIATKAGTITGLNVWNHTQAGGTPIIDLGKFTTTVTVVDTTGGTTSGWIVGEELAQATSLARGILISATIATAQVTLLIRPLEGEFTAGEITGGTSGNTVTPDTHVPTVVDPDFFIDAGNAWGMPESGYGLDIRSAEIVVGNAANQFTSVTVAAYDHIVFGTTGGGSSDPAGLFVQVEITPNPISGLEFWYDIIGY